MSGLRKTLYYRISFGRWWFQFTWFNPSLKKGITFKCISWMKHSGPPPPSFKKLLPHITFSTSPHLTPLACACPTRRHPLKALGDGVAPHVVGARQYDQAATHIGQILRGLGQRKKRRHVHAIAAAIAERQASKGRSTQKAMQHQLNKY